MRTHAISDTFLPFDSFKDILFSIYCKFDPDTMPPDKRYNVLLVYCTSNGTQFFVFKILHEGFFTLKICIRIDITKVSRVAKIRN